jgi:hypothetical protein
MVPLPMPRLCSQGTSQAGVGTAHRRLFGMYLCVQSLHMTALLLATRMVSSVAIWHRDTHLTGDVMLEFHVAALPRTVRTMVGAALVLWLCPPWAWVPPLAASAVLRVRHGHAAPGVPFTLRMSTRRRSDGLCGYKSACISSPCCW